MKKKLKKLMINSLVCLLSSMTLSWTGTEIISDTEINFFPYGCENSSGNAAVVWVSGSYPDLIIKTALFDGFSWSSPTTIGNVGANVSAKCGMDSSGNIVAIWESIDQSNNRTIISSRKPVNNSWDTPVTLSSSTYNTDIALGVNANGEVIAGWTDQINEEVQVVTLDFGNSWSSITTVDPGTGRFGNLQLDIDSLGNGIVVYENYDTGVIYASKTTGGFNSSWATPAALTSSGTNTGPRLKVNSSGDAIAAWTNVDTYEVDGALYQSGTWDSVEQLSSIGPNEFAAYPSVATSGTDFFVSYTNFATGETDGNATVSGVWGTPFELSSGIYSSDPASSYSSGTYYTVWADNTTGGVSATAYPVGGPSSSAVVISDVDDVGFTPQISASSAITLAVWENILALDHVIKVNTN